MPIYAVVGVLALAMAGRAIAAPAVITMAPNPRLSKMGGQPPTIVTAIMANNNPIDAAAYETEGVEDLAEQINALCQGPRRHEYASLCGPQGLTEQERISTSAEETRTITISGSRKSEPTGLEGTPNSAKERRPTIKKPSSSGAKASAASKKQFYTFKQRTSSPSTKPTVSGLRSSTTSHPSATATRKGEGQNARVEKSTSSETKKATSSSTTKPTYGHNSTRPLHGRAYKTPVFLSTTSKKPAAHSPSSKKPAIPMSTGPVSRTVTKSVKAMPATEKSTMVTGKKVSLRTSASATKGSTSPASNQAPVSTSSIKMAAGTNATTLHTTKKPVAIALAPRDLLSYIHDGGVAIAPSNSSVGAPFAGNTDPTAAATARKAFEQPTYMNTTGAAEARRFYTWAPSAGQPRTLEQVTKPATTTTNSGYLGSIIEETWAEKVVNSKTVGHWDGRTVRSYFAPTPIPDVRGTEPEIVDNGRKALP